MARPVRVALLDSAPGADVCDHDRRWTATVDGVDRGSLAARDHSHSDAMMATIAAHAPSARVESVAVSPGDEVVRMLQALRWLPDRGVDVVCVPMALVAENVVLAPALATLRATGTLIVAAVGNGGEGHACQPALDPNVLAVGACTSSGAPARSSGSLVDAARSVPDVLAVSDRGTSIASARVAGCAAELLARHRSARPIDVGWALVESAPSMVSELRQRSRRGLVDVTAADRLLAAGRRERGSAVAPPVPSGPAYVDPRLQWQVATTHPGRRVGAVVLRRGTTIETMTRGGFERLLADPDLVAASAFDIAIWTL